jgi:ribosomal protein L5
MAMNDEQFLQELLDYWTQISEGKKPAGVKALDEAIDKKAECKKQCAEFKNNCNMWILQLKAFVLDTLLDEKKANSQTFLNFLDELNKISVIL